MLCVGVLITLPGFIEQDSQYKRRYLVLCLTHLLLHSLNLISGCFFYSSSRDIPQNALLCSRLHWGVGGCSHYVFDTRALTLFSHPQMNTAKLQTPAVTLLQISHNSLKISQAVKITRLPRSPPLLFRVSILPAVILITHVHQICL